MNDESELNISVKLLHVSHTELHLQRFPSNKESAVVPSDVKRNKSNNAITGSLFRKI